MNRFSGYFDWVLGVWSYNVLSKIRTIYPKEIIVNLTYKCNSKCIMCNIWKSKDKEMGLNDWKEVIEDKIFSDVKGLTISGGEPILHDEFNEICNLFLTKLPKLKSLSVISNGFLTTKIVGSLLKLSDDCRKHNISLDISISLDGVGKKHEEIRRVPGGFKKILRTIKTLKVLQKKRKINLGIGSLLLKQNLDNFFEMEKWLKGNKINYSFQIVGFHKTFVNNLENRDKVDYSSSQDKKLLEVLKYLRDKLDRGNPRSFYWNDLIGMYFLGKHRNTPCPFLIDQMAVDGLGNVYYCLSEKKIGNFLNEKRSIKDIYFDTKNINRRKNMWMTCCRKCNSGCNVSDALIKDFKKYIWYMLKCKLN